jgi:glycogen(starch) synthase
MRVLLTTDTIGGVWTFTKELSENLLALGHDVALVSFGGVPRISHTNWCAQTTDAYSRSFTYYPSDIPLEWMQQNENVFAEGAALLEDIVGRFSPDVLHSSQFCWGALALSIPKLITAHSDVMSWSTATKPDVLAGSPWLDQYRSLVQHGLDGADAVAAPTMWMRDALQQHFTITCRAEVIYNGRTIGDYEMPMPGRKLQAVTAGRLWDEGKSLSTLFEITPAMPVILAGEDSLESTSTAIPLGVTAAGMLDEAELLRLFQQSSVYIVASVYEPFGLAPLEAALCGCAVLARHIVSLREVWGEDALYFRDARELEATLHQLSTNVTFLSRMQMASFTRSRQYPAKRMTLEYMTLYESLRGDGIAPRAQVEELVANAL